MIDSVPGRGTAVRIYLPRGVAAVAADDPPADRRHESLDGTVLLVEDNPQLRRAIARLLTARGLEVIEASRADEALDRLRQTADITLLLTDVGLPGDMDGFQLSVEARRLRPELRVLYMSGHRSYATTAESGGDSAVLQKPFGTDQLTTAVKATLDVR